MSNPAHQNPTRVHAEHAAIIAFQQYRSENLILTYPPESSRIFANNATIASNETLATNSTSRLKLLDAAQTERPANKRTQLQIMPLDIC